MVSEVRDTIVERTRTHGNYTMVAKLSQDLKSVARTGKWDGLTDDQKETLDMILHKVARVLSGDPNHPDHWHDIAGYATLTERRCQSVEGT